MSTEEMDLSAGKVAAAIVDAEGHWDDERGRNITTLAGAVMSVAHALNRIASAIETQHRETSHGS